MQQIYGPDLCFFSQKVLFQIWWLKVQTRCVWTTRMSPPWILRRLANVSPFFNSLSNMLRITNYCLRSVSSSLLKFTRFIQGNNIAWTNLDMIRNLQHLHMNKKSYTYKTLPFNSHWIFFWIKSVKVVTTKYLAKFQSPTALSWPKIIQLDWISELICNLWLYTLIPKIKPISQIIVK
jgi:hypothetical protein